MRGRFTLDELEDRGDRPIAKCSSLAERVHYKIDLASTFPKHYTGEVIVTLDDRPQSLRHREAINRGCADRPLSNAEIVAKYLDNASRTLTRDRAERVRDYRSRARSGRGSRLSPHILSQPV